MRAHVLAKRPDTEGDVTELLNMYNACKTFHTLPYGGGLLDQPARLVYLFDSVSVAYSELEARRAKEQAQAASAARRR